MSREDLIPFNRRTEAEQKEIAKKGGVKSGESRRRKRAFKQLAKQYLDADTNCTELRSELVAHGFDNDFSNAAALIMVIGKEAFSGNLRAAEMLIRLSGEDPEEKRKDAELKLKREMMQIQKTRYAPRGTDIEDLSCVWEMVNAPDDIAPVPMILDPEKEEAT